MTAYWGLLKPGNITSPRRTRSLQLASVVRYFNDRAVPGLGSVYFAKQLFLSVLGIAVAEEARLSGLQVQNIDVANTVEALACWYHFNGFAKHCERPAEMNRVRGSTRLKGIDNEYSTLRQHYVTNPMRAGAVEPLSALGFVMPGPIRFNAYRLSEIGENLLWAADAWKVVSRLVEWTGGNALPRRSRSLPELLNPYVPLPKPVLMVIEDRFHPFGDMDSDRRFRALQLVRRLIRSTRSIDWADCPAELDPDHCRDLEAGRRFFELRDRAVAILDTIERRLAHSSEIELAVADVAGREISTAIQALRKAAKGYLDQKYELQPDAHRFACDCLAEDAAVIRELVRRDTHVLRLLPETDRIRRGPAFDGNPPAEKDKSVDLFPPNTSFRLVCLLEIARDMESRS